MKTKIKCPNCGNQMEVVEETIAEGEREIALEKAAKKAATTGNRKDLHEYLKLRRRLI